jgi:uncharacterized protein YktB (UPF0637 family)
MKSKKLIALFTLLFVYIYIIFNKMEKKEIKIINHKEEIKNEIHNNFAECCRYMEGHTHSNQFAYKKIETKDLLDAIEGYEKLKKRIISTLDQQKKNIIIPFLNTSK